MYKSEQIASGDAMFDSGELVLDLPSLDGQANITQFSQLLHWTDDYEPPLVLNQDEIILPQQEETMDAATKFSVVPQTQEFVPISPIGPPERDNFSGNLKFEVEICGADTHKSKYMYSHRLDRIYVDMGYSFSVRLKWDASAQPDAAMLVRATPVFTYRAQAEKRVIRCIQHYHEKPKNGVEMSEAMRSSVLHSTRDVGTQDVFYCGDLPDVWYSVVVRFTGPSTHAYQFACKNSCSSGINRRPITIIFTLEDYAGTVWGRRSVSARVCSCPKRDMRRDEAEEAPSGKRPLPPAPAAPLAPAAPRPKKIKLEVRREEDSDEVISLPQISVVGRRVYTTGLGVMLNMMEEKRETAARAHLPTDQLDVSIAQLRHHLDLL